MHEKRKVNLADFVFNACVPILLVFVLLLLIPALSGFSWLAPDWENFYRPAALSPSPYDVRGNHAPPWTYLILYPLAMLPDNMSKGALTLATIGVCMLYLKMDKRRILILCLTMPFLATVAFGQTDALSLVGLMVPPSLSLIFLTMKPQGVMLTAFKKRLTLASVYYLGGLLIFSFLLWGAWPLRLLDRGVPMPNCAIWPYGIPFGLGLLYWQWRRGFDSDAILCLASLLFSPYFFFSNLLPVTAATIKELDRDDWHSLGLLITLSWFFAIASVLRLQT